MKYLKYFEEAEFDIKITDQPELKMSKERFQDFKKYLKDYNDNKKLIDKIYLNAKTDADLKKGIEDLLKKINSPNKEEENPFIVEYLNVANLKRKMDTLQKELVNDKISKSDFSQQLGLASEQTTKDAITTKLTDINNRISTKTTTISSLSKDVNDSEKKIKDKMSKMEKEMKDYIKNISFSAGK